MINKDVSYPKVSIIILNWNRLNDTIECLDSIRKSDYPNYEVIVVDNASTHGSPDRVKEIFPEVTLIKNKENLGFAGGNNIGIRYALANRIDYVWLLNNDTVIETDTLSKLIAEAKQDKTIGLLSPVIYFYDNPMAIQFCGSYFDYENFSIIYFKDLNEAKNNSLNELSLWGTALLIRRSLIEKIGGLSEYFFLYHEDAEYFLRSLKSGFQNRLVLNSKIFHKNVYTRNEQYVNRPRYWFFYMSRNRYFLWANNLSLLKRMCFLRKYLARSVRSAGYICKESNNFESASIFLDGMYSAIFNIKGSIENSIRMPTIIKKIILFQPYFLAELLDFHFKQIIINLCQKLV